jgi:hypothetical protein
VHSLVELKISVFCCFWLLCLS